jgi:D-sedoheptulose 7-phosphate isomerase
MQNIDLYLNEVVGLLNGASREGLRQVVDLLMEAYREDRQVFIIGNGGSAATASHMACDLQKTVGLNRTKKFRAMSLTDNVPIMTAWANDFDYTHIFSGPLETFIKPDDLVIAISGSGNSPNVIRAIEMANEKGAVTIGMSGFQGGKLAQICKYNLIVPSDNMQQIEDVHMVFCHLVFRRMLEELGDPGAGC